MPRPTYQGDREAHGTNCRIHLAMFYRSHRTATAIGNMNDRDVPAATPCRAHTALALPTASAEAMQAGQSELPENVQLDAATMQEVAQIGE